MVKSTKYPKGKEFLHYYQEKLGYNLSADPYQKAYVEAMLTPPSECIGVFNDSPAGTGKTALAVKTGYYLLEQGLVDEIIYYRSPLSIHDMGFLGGSLEEKSYPYMVPCIDAINDINHNKKEAEKLVADGKLQMLTSTYERGTDRKGKKFIILDEAQNFTKGELQAVLTRPHDDAKVVVIGSTLQNDAPSKTLYGRHRIQPFSAFIRHYTKEQDTIPCREIKLVNNYRGQFSMWADKIDETLSKMEEEQQLLKD